MKQQIIGIQEVEFTTEDNQKIQGVKLHLGSENEHVDGLAVDKVFVPARIDTSDLEVGDIVKISYNKYGKVDEIIKF